MKKGKYVPPSWAKIKDCWEEISNDKPFPDDQKVLFRLAVFEAVKSRHTYRNLFRLLKSHHLLGTPLNLCVIKEYPSRLLFVLSVLLDAHEGYKYSLTQKKKIRALMEKVEIDIEYAENLYTLVKEDFDLLPGVNLGGFHKPGLKFAQYPQKTPLFYRFQKN